MITRYRTFHMEPREASLILPEALKPIRRKRSVSGRRLQIAMTEIMGERPSILPIISKLITSRMPQHVRMNLERKLSGLARSPNHSQEPSCCNRSASFRYEYVRAIPVVVAARPEAQGRATDERFQFRP
jgi:hypothetical protein